MLLRHFDSNYNTQQLDIHGALEDRGQISCPEPQGQKYVLDNDGHYGNCMINVVYDVEIVSLEL